MNTDLLMKMFRIILAGPSSSFTVRVKANAYDFNTTFLQLTVGTHTVATFPIATVLGVADESALEAGN